jgi:SAM-dependent methyltransferase
MRIAPDGSPVELYLRLPERTEEAALVHDLLPSGGSVLDLGCGTGRLAEPLARLGHPVTGVDNEPEMLAALRLASGVCADIASLDLGERFDAVLLMSHFVDTADEPFVAAVLRTVRRHVRDGGVAVVERYPPGWVTTCVEGISESQGVRYTLRDLIRAEGTLTGTLRYEFIVPGAEPGAAPVSAEQRFSAREVDDAELSALAQAAGLRFDSALDAVGTLVALRPVG